MSCAGTGPSEAAVARVVSQNSSHGFGAFLQFAFVPASSRMSKPTGENASMGLIEAGTQICLSEAGTTVFPWGKGIQALPLALCMMYNVNLCMSCVRTLMHGVDVILVHYVGVTLKHDMYVNCENRWLLRCRTCLSLLEMHQAHAHVLQFCINSYIMHG